MLGFLNSKKGLHGTGAQTSKEGVLASWHWSLYGFVMRLVPQVLNKL